MPALTVTVTDDATPTPVPLEGANVVLMTAGGFLVAAGRTDAAGEVVLSPPAGTYLLEATGARHGAAAPVEVALADDPAAQAVELPALGIEPADPPAECLVYGNLDLPAGLLSVPVFVDEIHPSRVLASGGSGVNPERVWLVSAARTVLARGGYFEVRVRQGATVRLQVPDLSLEKTFWVKPGTEKLSLADAVSVLGATAAGLTGDNATVGTRGGPTG